jgi:hypothetical protein
MLLDVERHSKKNILKKLGNEIPFIFGLFLTLHAAHIVAALDKKNNKSHNWVSTCERLDDSNNPVGAIGRSRCRAGGADAHNSFFAVTACLDTRAACFHCASINTAG